MFCVLSVISLFTAKKTPKNNPPQKKNKKQVNIP